MDGDRLRAKLRTIILYGLSIRCHLRAAMTPKFIYFDLGKVLLDFSFEQMCRQVGEASGIGPDQVAAVFAGGMQADYETGKLDSSAFHERFCRESGTRP